MKTIHAILLIALLNVFIIINANEKPTEKLTTMLSLEVQHKQMEAHHLATLQEINDTYHEVKNNHNLYKARAAALSTEIKKPTVSSYVKELHALAVTYVERFSILEQYWHGKLEEGQKELHELAEKYRKKIEERE